MENQYKSFFEWLLEKPVELYSAKDIATEKNIYYPKELKNIIDTKEMQRLKKILQLSTVIIDEDTTYHTRFEHVLGTYDKGVFVYLNQFQKADWRKDHNNQKDKLNITATLIELLTHDIGHLTFSHTLENLIGKYGAHEIITERIIDEKLKGEIEKIDPNLPQIITERRNNQTGTLIDGNVDLDRMDYLVHDIIYIDGGNLEIESLVNKILANITIEKINIDGKIDEVPIFENCIINDIQRLLEIRAEGYQNLYNSNRTIAISKIYKQLCDEILSSKEESTKKLKKFLQECIKNKTNLDLSVHLNSDDIKTFNTFLEIAENSQNEDLRKKAILCLPTLSGMTNIIYKMIDFSELVDCEGANLEAILPIEDERNFFKKIKKYIKSDSLSKEEKDIKKMLLGKSVAKEDGLYIYDFKDDFDKVKSNLENLGIPKQVIDEIIWKNKLKKYDSDTINLARTEDGDIVNLLDHPDFKFDLTQQYICGGYVYDAKLKQLGLSEEQIQEIKNMLKDYLIPKYQSKRNPRRPSIVANNEDAIQGRYNNIER